MTAGTLTPEMQHFIEGEGKADLRQAFDEVHRAGRLNLALQRMIEAKQEAGLDSPEALIAWETHLALTSAIERMARYLGYSPKDEKFEV